MGLAPPVWGARRAVLNDLGPAATFIAANYNLPFGVDAFEREARRILAELDRELGWMYETTHTDGRKGRINYTVWSQIFACPTCGGEINFLREALDPASKRVRHSFNCPSCQPELTKGDLQRLFDTELDPATRETWRRVRFAPVMENYSIDVATHEKPVDAADVSLLERIGHLTQPAVVPTTRFPIDKMYHGSRLAPKGFTNVHHLYLARPAQALGSLWTKALQVENARLRSLLLFWLDSHLVNLSIQNRYRPEVSFP